MLLLELCSTSVKTNDVDNEWKRWTRCGQEIAATKPETRCPAAAIGSLAEQYTIAVKYSLWGKESLNQSHVEHEHLLENLARTRLTMATGRLWQTERCLSLRQQLPPLLLSLSLLSMKHGTLQENIWGDMCYWVERSLRRTYRIIMSMCSGTQY